MLVCKDYTYDSEGNELEGFRTEGCGCCSRVLTLEENRDSIIEELKEMKEKLLEFCEIIDISIDDL